MNALGENPNSVSNTSSRLCSGRNGIRAVAGRLRRNQNSPEIPPDEISLIDAGFGGMEEWRKILETRNPSGLEVIWGGIEIPPQIPPHEIPLIDKALVSMGGMGGSFKRLNCNHPV